MYTFYFLKIYKNKKVIQKIKIRNKKIRNERDFAVKFNMKLSFILSNISSLFIADLCQMSEM